MKCLATFLAVLPLMVSVASAELVVLQHGRDGYTGAQDTTILTLDSTNNGAHANGIYQTHYIDYGGEEYRSLFSWDVSAQSGRTVAGDATITLTRDGQHPSQNNDVDFYGVTETWTEGGANSSTRDGIIAWAGGDLLGAPGASASMTALLDSTGLTAGNTASTLTIPAATVTDWLTSGFASVVGVMAGRTNDTWSWHSKDSTSQGTLQDQKPKLTLDLVGGTPSTDFTWNSSETGAWTTEQNWLPLGGPPGNPSAGNPDDHSATFGDAISAATTVVVDTDQTIHAITFDNTASYVIAGAASVNLIGDSLEASPSVSVVQGNHEFQADVTLLNDTQVTVGTGALLEFNNLLNLGSNALTKLGDGEMAINNILSVGGDGGGIICAAGTCSGSGTIGGSLTVGSGATLSPGSSLGVLAAEGVSAVVPEPATWMLLLIGLMTRLRVCRLN